MIDRVPQSVDDPEVVRHVRRYQAALQAGEHPDRAELLARFPQIAEELVECLDALDFVHHVAPQLREPGSALAGLDAATPLGDFQITREIGRGGMGVVYEAKQLSLGRRVALKVLPFAAVLDSRQLQRFKNEAQAAAHLQHQSIVPVYSVGAERGVHYYAMQYIEGLTVAQVIDELRAREGQDGETKRGSSSAAVEALTSGDSTRSRSFCRAVARLGIQAAEALDYAHEQGVIHRDVKPGNLIVDAGGNLWITDFGLASVRDSGNRSLTMSGDLLGTLRYMSPEQALAKRIPIDHRTDTYSLGVTFYEFLTLDPAFAGTDSRSILRDIAEKEPRPATQLNPTIPPDLETILMKAMAKSPADRYETAQQLADDLRRFLDDKPIEAKRPSVFKRAGKWCARHKPVVATALVLGVLALVGLAIGTVLIQDAYESEAEQRTRAEANLRRAREVVEQLLTEVAAKDLADLPRASGIRRRLLDRALPYYEDFLRESGDDPAARDEATHAYVQVAEIRWMLGDRSGAERAYRRALELVQQLVADFPDAPRHALSLASIHRGLANAVPAGHGSEQMFDESIAIGKRLVAEFPHVEQHWQLLAHAYNDLGTKRVQRGRHAEAAEPIRSALSIYRRLLARSPSMDRYSHWVAGSELNLAISLSRTGDEAEAEDTLVRVLHAWTDLLTRSPDDLTYRLSLRNAYNNLGVLLSPPTPLTEALHMTHGFGDRQLVGTPDGQPAFAPVSPGHAGPSPPESVLSIPERSQRAIACFRTARIMVEPLYSLFPGRAHHSMTPTTNLALALARVGDHEGALAMYAEMVARNPDSLGAYRHYAHFLVDVEDPRVLDVHEGLRFAGECVRIAPRNWTSWFVLGEARYRNGDWAGAVEALETAEFPEGWGKDSHSLLGFFLAMAKWQLGDSDAALELFHRASRQMDESDPHYHEDLWKYRNEAAELLGLSTGTPPR